jgi:RNA polymerase sigma-70 factor (ECF subfamily)
VPAKTATTNPSEWVEKHGDYLYRYALMRLRDPAAAEDAVQETLLAAWKARERFDGRVDEKYWLRGILRNKVVDHIRKAVREHPVSDGEIGEVQDRHLLEKFGIPTRHPKPWEFDVHRAYEKEEFWDIFNSCLGKMKGSMQRAFSLKMLEGVSTAETCKILDVTPNNLWVIMHRARGQMKECLEKNWARGAD